MNPKHEYRNSKQIQNSNTRKVKIKLKLMPAFSGMTRNGSGKCAGNFADFGLAFLASAWYNVIENRISVWVRRIGRKNPEKGRSGFMETHHRIGFGPAGVIFCAFFTFAAMACAGVYSGGSGTAMDPYKISKAADWQELIATSADWDKHFILLNDIDFGGMNLTPVGFAYPPFTGVFEGNRHVLRNAKILMPTIDNISIFGYIDNSGRILNLGAENVTISGHEFVGGLVGMNDHGILTSCYATGTVNGSAPYSCVGGLVGENNHGIIAACYATCSVSGSGEVGGLVGNQWEGSLVACYATGPVNSSNYAGGLVGYNRSGTLITCFAAGAVNGTMNNTATGGLVAAGSGSVTTCFWDMESSGQTGSVGGKGLTTEQMKTVSIFQNAEWAGKYWVMNNGVDYPRLSWQNSGGAAIPAPGPIPLAGSGTENDPYRVSTAEEFAALSWYSQVLYQRIQLTRDLDLKDVALDPIGDLGWFTGVFDGNGHTLSNAVIHQPDNHYVGLFGILGTMGQIRNVGVVNVTMTGSGFVGGLVGRIDHGYLTSCYVTGTISGSVSVGSLAGNNYYGTLTSCSAAAVVNGSENAGGLVGSSSYGTLSWCSASGAISGNYYIGGLVGRMETGTINSCYATGSVSGSGYYVGGLIGKKNYGTLTDCYAAGLVNGSSRVGGLCGSNVDTITACFWDTQASGQSQGVGDGPSTGVTGKTTAEMKQQSTFASMDWDFSTVWMICESVSYPHLIWEEFSCSLSRYSGGIGTAEYPFLISTVADWQELIATSADWDKNFILLNDIDFGGMSLTPVAPDIDTSTSDFQGTAFVGVCEGNGHVLRNVVLSMPDADYAGLFGRIGTGGCIRSLGIQQVNISGKLFTGGLVGDNRGEITDCYTSGSVSGVYCVGGLVGWNNGTIMACNAGSVMDPAGFDFYSIGGLVGENYGTITESFATGPVNGPYMSISIGGLVGQNDGSISTCYATGSVIGSAGVGGLVGRNVSGPITACYATGSVSGSFGLGGLVGDTWDGTISSCYAIGSVTITELADGYAGSAGGLVGGNDGMIAASFSAGTVSVAASVFAHEVGGLVGRNYNGPISSCFWDIETSGQSWSDGGEGKTTAEMKTLSTFAGAGWDFVGESANGTADIWRMCAGGVSYPRLSWEFSSGGDFGCPDGVALEDVLYLAGRWMANTPEGVGAADGNGDGKVDLADFALFAGEWMK
jgi:hypothetical protein